MSKSKIEWTNRVWNPVTGCTKISTGCKNCYAEELHNKRHKAYWEGKLQGLPQYARPFSRVQLHPERLGQPLHWKKPQKVFVNSMSDLFHKDVPFEFIEEVWDAMFDCSFAKKGFRTRHIFQILTKRPERAIEFYQYMEAHNLKSNYNNIWFGVTVENQEQADKRIPLLLQIPAAVRFISVEPMLGPIKLISSGTFIDHNYMTGEVRHKMLKTNDDIISIEKQKIDWVICGGESGKNARPMHPDWVRSLRDQCKAADVPFFFKQWGKYKILYERSNPPEFTFEREYFRYNRINISGGQDSHGGNLCYYKKVGKRNSGCLVDGVEYKEFPKT
jgi:protein gp37